MQVFYSSSSNKIFTKENLKPKFGLLEEACNKQFKKEQYECAA